jgi:putative acetyltransferase
MTPVRPEAPPDAAAIARVHERAFGRADEARLVEALRDSTAYVPELSLVAEDDDGLAGHVMLTRAHVSDEDGGRAFVLVLAPIGVVPERQRSGVGSALVWAALGAADGLGAPLVTVLGDPAYWSRFDFVAAYRHGIAPPAPIPGDAFQARARGRGPDPGIRGTLVYPPPFAALPAAPAPG